MSVKYKTFEIKTIQWNTVKIYHNLDLKKGHPYEETVFLF